MHPTPATAPPPLRAVIIDDTAEQRELLGIALTRAGIEVVGEAGDGLAGIETVGETHPDVVLIDLSMPVMDGIAALPGLRRLVPDATIIVLSGFSAARMAERVRALGADGYLQKDTPVRRIVEQIGSVAAARAIKTG